MTINLDSFRNRKNRLFARGTLFLKIMISKFYIIIAIGSTGSVVILVEMAGLMKMKAEADELD
jgi:hypothetical protein